MAGNLMMFAKNGFSTLIRSQRRLMSEHAPSKYRPYHMDDFPVPSGSWEEGFRKKQAGHNKILAFGLLFFATTVTIASQSGLIYINLTPKMPAED